MTPLIAAVLAKDMGKIDQLIKAGANVNQYYNGKTALHYAIDRKKVDVIELLIKKGAKLRLYDQRNKSALELIFMKLNQRSVLQLIKSFPDVNERDDFEGNTALHYAAQYNYYDCAALLLSLGTNVQIVNQRGQIALYLATVHGSAGIIELLAGSGADVNRGDKNGWTPIFQAVFRGDIPMIELLVRLGADVDRVDSKGWTPLFYAIQKADDLAVQVLLKYCRDVGYEHVVRYSAVGLARQIRNDTSRELISGRIENKLLMGVIFADNGVVSTMLF